MAAVTGFTKERMLEIENTCITSGAVVLDDLILTQRDGTQINAGNVRGPQGIQGIQGIAATIQSASASELAAGAAPTVTLGGTPQQRTFAFGIPKGDKGDKGDQGIQGIQGVDGVQGSAATPAGTITLWASDVAPANWLICDGSAVSRTTYASLFATIGTKYGAGDGVNTFNLPNLKGQTPVGKDAAQTEFAALNQKGGEKTHLLTKAEMPSHSHGGVTGQGYGWPFSTGMYSTGGSTNFVPLNWGGSLVGNDATYEERTKHTHPISPDGSDTPHNNLQPYTVVNFIIKFTNGDSPNDSQLTQRVSTLETFTGASPAGTITIWGGESPPTNWLICDGAAISRTTYASLFAAIGTKYGAGDGSTTFNLPNFKGRTPTGLDTTQTEFNALGKTGGSKTHRHYHSSQIGLSAGNVAVISPGDASQDQFGADTSFNYIQSSVGYGNLSGPNAGSLEIHKVSSSIESGLSPYLTINYIIKFTNGDTQGDSQLTQRVGALENGNNVSPVIDRTMARLQRALSGGGVRKVFTAGIAWTQPFVTPSVAQDGNVPSGTFVADMPANGTVIPIAGGSTSVTVANGVVPLTGWQALYFVIPLGQAWNASTFSATNYRIIDYNLNQAFTPPQNWLLICARVNDGVSPAYTWGDGRSQDFWHDLTLVNSWVNYSGAFANAGYKLQGDGDIKLRGLIKSGTGVIATVPVVYAPAFIGIFQQHAGGGTVRVDIQQDGTLLPQSYLSGTNAYVSLEGMRWTPQA